MGPHQRVASGFNRGAGLMNLTTYEAVGAVPPSIKAALAETMSGWLAPRAMAATSGVVSLGCRILWGLAHCRNPFCCDTTIAAYPACWPPIEHAASSCGHKSSGRTSKTQDVLPGAGDAVLIAGHRQGAVTRCGRFGNLHTGRKLHVNSMGRAYPPLGNRTQSRTRLTAQWGERMRRREGARDTL